MLERVCGSKKVESVEVSDPCKLHPRRLPSHGRADQQCPQVTINKLPNEVLLEIFGFCMAYPLPPLSHQEDAWHTLVHVCRRWRYIVFGSPRHLNLRLLCMNKRLLKTLDIWPELPIVVHVDDGELCQPPGVTDVVSMLKRNDRVCKVIIDNVSNPLLEELATVNESFPALIELELVSTMVDPLTLAPRLSHSSLGGSIPSLRSLTLCGISIRAIGNLLVSTRDLVTLTLGCSPPSGYISPEAMVAILSTLTRLESLHLSFEIPQFPIYGGSRRPLVPTRIDLPALTTFAFDGHSRYLADMVSRIDAPLDCITLTVNIFDPSQLEFDFPLLRDFIWRTKLFNEPHRADTSFKDHYSVISLFQRKGGVDFKVFSLEIPCYALISRLLTLAQACSLLLLPLSGLEHLSLYKSKSDLLSLRWQSEVENAHLMEFIRPFIAVKDLVLEGPVVFSIASALQELVGGRVTEILPALQNIFLQSPPSSDPAPEGICKFIAARELCGCPVVVHHQEWEI